jgi:hypothetical protein
MVLKLLPGSIKMLCRQSTHKFLNNFWNFDSCFVYALRIVLKEGGGDETPQVWSPHIK